MLVIGSVYAELASALPWVGGEHVYAQRRPLAWRRLSMHLGHHPRLFLRHAFEAVALPTVLETLVPGLDAYPLWTLGDWTVTAPRAGVGCATALLLTLLNMRGLRFAAVMQTVFVLAMLGVGVLLFFGAFSRGSLENPEALFPQGLSGFSAVLMMVPFLFVGFDVIPQAAEELRIPRQHRCPTPHGGGPRGALVCLCGSQRGPRPADGGGALRPASPADAMRALWGSEARGLLVLAGLGGF